MTAFLFDLLLTPPELKALAKQNLRLLPFNLALTAGCLAYYFHLGAGIR